MCAKCVPGGGSKEQLKEEELTPGEHSVIYVGDKQKYSRESQEALGWLLEEQGGQPYGETPVTSTQWGASKAHDESGGEPPFCPEQTN